MTVRFILRLGRSDKLILSLITSLMYNLPRVFFYSISLLRPSFCYSLCYSLKLLSRLDISGMRSARLRRRPRAGRSVCCAGLTVLLCVWVRMWVCVCVAPGGREDTPWRSVWHLQEAEVPPPPPLPLTGQPLGHYWLHSPPPLPPS